LVSWNDTLPEAPFSITSNLVANLSFEVDPADSWVTPSLSINGDSLYIELEKNTSSEIREATIKVFDDSKPSVYDTVKVIQTGLDVYLVINPSFQSAPFTGGEASFSILTLNVESWKVDKDRLPDWIVVSDSTDNTLVLTIEPNPTFAFRDTLFWVYDVNNPTVTDSATIYQKAAPAPSLLASPREKIISHTGKPDVSFKVSRVNVNNWSVDLYDSEWITVVQSGGDLLVLSVTENQTLETRTSPVRIFDPGNPGVEDTVYLYQYSALDTFLLAAPREQLIPHTGASQVDFFITQANTGGWDFTDTSPYEDWITFDNLGDTMRLEVSENTTLETRQALIKIHANDNPDVTDSVSVYQFSALDKYILAAPREFEVPYTASTVNFDVIAVNLGESWDVDIISGEDWITIMNYGDDSLLINVEENSTISSRVAIVRLYSPSDNLVSDTVAIYQFAAPESYLLAAPREQRIPHFGKDTVDFVITQVNVNGWTFTDTIPYQDWITFDNLGDTMRLNIDENLTLETRQAIIKIHATDNPTVTDSVAVYQFSALDKYILAAPREFEVPYTASTVNFDVIAVNLGESWQFEILEGDQWIVVIEHGEDSLLINVSANDTISSRVAIVRLYSPSDNLVSDTVAIYQFAAPDPFILVAPREQWAPHTGMRRRSLLMLQG
jgi:alpha-D-ribose 1-methylphosphonate 5-phosphate C-P lyase